MTEIELEVGNDQITINNIQDPLTQPWRHTLSSSRNKVLSVLKSARGKRLSTAQISRRADLSWATASMALKELMYLGMASGERIGNSVFFEITEGRQKCAQKW